VRRRLPWLLLAGLLLVIAVLILRHDAGTVGPLSTGEFGALAYRVALLAFLAGAAITLFRGRVRAAITAGLLWIAIALVLLVAYTYRYPLHDIANRVLPELIPGRAVSAGRTVEIARASTGDFAIAAQVNGTKVAMILDTGASSVVLTNSDAKAAGLPLEVLEYTVSIDTANGRTRAAPVTLDRIGVGNLVERSVEALVAKPGALKTSLLGMSFLNRLQSWEVSGDRLLLRGYP